jgi:D-glycero-D-manno-heptose 1,7-bisphosphate phosphatase
VTLVILDRDGVINHDSINYIKSPDEWLPIEGALQAIARLNHAGFRVVIATNQSGLSRKLYDIEMLNRIHEKMQRQLSEVGGTVEAVFFCPHSEKDHCECRKPKPGMLLEIGERLRVSMEGVPVIGDSPRDLEAARAAGARPILVRTGNGAETEAQLADEKVEVFDNLPAAVNALIAERASS